MNRRAFLASASVASAQQNTKSKLLLPSDEPDEFGFRLMWYSPVPPIDRRSYRLKVGGLVDKPLAFDLAALRKFPQEKQNSRMKCVQCWSARAEWGGFRWGHLFEAAKPAKNAKAVRVDSADKWYEHFSLQELLSPRMMVVLDMAGQPLSDPHGGPLRLLAPSKYGYKSAKLVTAITFVEEGKGSMACDIGPYYTPSGDILAGYDTPLDLGGKGKRKIGGGEIMEY